MSDEREQFWQLLWGEECYSLAEWHERGCPDAPITRSRFKEVFERFSERLKTEREAGRLSGMEQAAQIAEQFYPMVVGGVTDPIEVSARIAKLYAAQLRAAIREKIAQEKK